MVVENAALYCESCMDPFTFYECPDACVCQETDAGDAYLVSMTYMGESFSVNVNLGWKVNNEEYNLQKAAMMAAVIITQSRWAQRLEAGGGWAWTVAVSRANAHQRASRVVWRNNKDNGGLIYYP